VGQHVRVLRWVNGDDHLPTGTRNELVVDEQTRGLLILVAIWSRDINEEISHFKLLDS
jgi:hypothetical protein